MPKKIIPTGKQKSMLFLHIVVFAIATAASWMLYQGKDGHWSYPWPAWTTAAWALCLLGHACIVYRSYDDPGYAEYRKQQGKN